MVRGLSLASLENTATGWSSAPRPAARHDAAVLHLLAAELLDPEVKKESSWLCAFSEWRQVIESDDYWAMFIDAEMEGDFEPTSTVEEIEKIREETLRLVANPLVVIAKDTVTRGEFALCSRALHVKSAQTNRLACEQAVARFDTEVEPHLRRILELVGSDSAIGRRTWEAAARCLYSLAIDWEWTSDFIGAKSLLLRGRTLARDTSAAVRIDEELERIAAFVQQQKILLEESQQTEKQQRAEAALRLFVAQCAELRSDCAGKVKRDEESVATNRAVCEAAVTRFDKEVEPPLWMLVGSVDTDSDVAFRAREAAALCLHGLAIDYTWADEFVLAETLLARAKAIAPSGSVALSRIEESLTSVGKQARQERVWKNLKPMSRAPSLQTVNGFGFHLYGKTDEDPESGSYLATYYFVALFIPFLPICRYRVINAGNGSQTPPAKRVA